MLASKPPERTAEKLEVRAPRIDQSFEHNIQIIITSASLGLLCAGGARSKARLYGWNALIKDLRIGSSVRLYLEGGESNYSASCGSMCPASNAASSPRLSLPFFAGKPASCIL